MKYYITELRRALNDLLANDNKVILLGEDIQDPFGGCFKVTQGLSTKFPGRVINTPISEAAIIGIATGLAIKGFKPIVEIMFYDFMTLGFDQLLNHTLKFKKLWDIDINITIRTAVGNKDYGATHSQDLDYIFEKIMKIYHPKANEDVYSALINAVNDNQPTLFVEEAGLYKNKLDIL